MIDRTANYATISRPAGGTALLTPLTGTISVNDTDDEAIAALVADSGSDTAAALTASFVGRVWAADEDLDQLGVTYFDFEGEHGFTSYMNSTNWWTTKIPQRIFMDRGEDDPSGARQFVIGFYEFGAMLEYAGILEANVGQFSVKSASYGVSGAQMIVGDDFDMGSLRLMARRQPVTLTDAAMTSGTNTVTSASADFVATDVGKPVEVSGAGPAGALLKGVITVINSESSAELGTLGDPGTDKNAGTTVSGATFKIYRTLHTEISPTAHDGSTAGPLRAAFPHTYDAFEVGRGPEPGFFHRAVRIGFVGPAYEQGIQLGPVDAANVKLYRSAAGRMTTDGPLDATLTGARVKRTTDQTGIVSGAPTAVQFTAEDWDTDDYHDNSTNPNRITIPAGLGGTYRIEGGVVFSPNATGRRLVYVNKNGGAPGYLVFDSRLASPVGHTGIAVNVTVELAAADYLELMVFHEAGTNLLLDVTNVPDAAAFMSVERVGA